MSNEFFFQAGGPNPSLIPNSLRFRGQQYFSRSYSGSSSGQGQVWTLSMWLKDSVENTDRTIFAAGNGGEFYNSLSFAAGNSLGSWSYVKNNGQRPFFQSGDRFRDPSGWFHFVIRTETTNGTSALRDRFYINGVEYTNFPTWRNESSQNQGLPWMGSTTTHYVGSNYNGQQPWRGYMAEVHCCDGQSYGPEQFGEFNDNGVWTPIIPNGLTYGNWGFHLDFSDPANIGADRSGRGNNFTPTGFELTNTSSTSYDWMADSPTDNRPIINPLQITNAGRTNTTNDANLTSNHDNEQSISIPMDTQLGGKYYAEVQVVTAAGAGEPSCGIFNQLYGQWRDGVGRGDGAYSWMYKGDGVKRNNSSQSSYGSNWRAVGSNIGIMLDLDNRQLSFRTNGTNNGVAYSSLPDGIYTMEIAANGGTWRTALNGGQRPFKYTPPAGFEPLSTAALPDVAITNPKKFFDIVLYSGNNGTQSITGLDFQPDIVWIKDRTVNSDHLFWDSLRGQSKVFKTVGSGAEENDSNALLSFNSNGFTVGQSTNGNPTNTSGRNYVAWCWKKAPGVLDIVQYTGNGGVQNITHNLGVKPAVIWVKNRYNTQQFMIYNHGWGATYASFWSPGSNFDPNSNYWNNTEPTSSQFTLSSATTGNQSGNTYVAYLFAEIPGFMQAGKVTGNGSTDGIFVYTGFRPRYVMWKNGSTTNNWFLVDSERDSYNPCLNELYVDSASQESQGAGSGGIMDFCSNGFKLRSSYSDRNGNGNYFAYQAFAEHPFGGSNVYPSPAR